MLNNFRKIHLTAIWEKASSSPLPLDVFLRKYFYHHRSIGAHDRRFLTETLYTLTRWHRLVEALCGTHASLEQKVAFLETFDPLHYLEKENIPASIRVSFPPDYFSFLLEELGPSQALSFALESNYPAPTTIRTNTLKISREALWEKLSTTHPVTLAEHSPLGIHFAKRTNFLAMPEFFAGLFEVQDEASQLAALQVRAKPGDHVLDYCAGSGGKSLAIAPQLQGKGQLYLHDIRPAPLQEAKKRLSRAGIQNAQYADAEKLQKSPWKGKMDWVFVDVPCSGSGTLRRNPDMKEKFSKTNLIQLCATQREIFEKALAYVKPQGHIVYTTCSVFPCENEKQIDHFLEKHPLKLCPPTLHTFPKREKMDGFFSAVLQKW